MLQKNSHQQLKEELITGSDDKMMSHCIKSWSTEKWVAFKEAKLPATKRILLFLAIAVTWSLGFIVGQATQQNTQLLSNTDQQATQQCGKTAVNVKDAAWRNGCTDSLAKEYSLEPGIRLIQSRKTGKVFLAFMDKGTSSFATAKALCGQHLMELLTIDSWDDITLLLHALRGEAVSMWIDAKCGCELNKDPIGCDWYWRDTGRAVNKTLLTYFTFGSGDGNSNWQLVADGSDAPGGMDCTLPRHGRFPETGKHVPICQVQLSENPCSVDYLVIGEK